MSVPTITSVITATSRPMPARSVPTAWRMGGEVRPRLRYARRLGGEWGARLGLRPQLLGWRCFPKESEGDVYCRVLRWLR
ncbi:MAG: hypothetical protein QOK36_777 [Gaiellales bacterium]|jgi:hypothetical protein|nr:hypothetical protein [Gaiellales bacterium]